MLQDQFDGFKSLCEVVHLEKTSISTIEIIKE